MMGASSTPQADLTPQADQAALERFADAAADDDEVLALLHGAELGPDVLSALHEQQIRDFLGLVPVGSAARGWLSALEAAIKLLPRPDDAAGIDALAADYADIYLRYHYRAAPT